jgi:hypothetical protein
MKPSRRADISALAHHCTGVANCGQDANATAYGCSVAHPCRTPAGALPQANSGGEVVALAGAGIVTYASGLFGPSSAHVSRSMVTGWSSGVTSQQSTPHSSVDVVESDLIDNNVAAVAGQQPLRRQLERAVIRYCAIRHRP